MKPLRNRWFALRHGRSEANARGLVVSRPENGLARYGLSEEGRLEARDRLAPARLAPLALAPAATLVLTSDFRRARETAEVLCELNGLAPATPEPRLRERSFGELELGPSATGYERIWALDRASATHRERGVESVVEVRARMASVVEDVEREREGWTVVLVSHGDPLQILQAWLEGRRAEEHREVRHLETAELRRLGGPE
ncbi:MAG TPA: histidine phosphatase family protein [Planctomycetota bacterium]|nr:histidine phosphatase family protein [Planctomycetota bacterium]